MADRTQFTQVRLLQDGVTFSSEADWQVRSILRFAERVHDELGDSSPTARTMQALIANFIHAAALYYDRGNELLPPESLLPARRARRALVAVIGEEWSRVMALAGGTNLVLHELQQDELLQGLRKVVQAAWQSLVLDEDQPVVVLPHFGRNFELVSFEYAPEAKVLGVPVESLYCPWEWTLIWHEAAGIYLKTDAARQLIDDLIADPEVQGVWDLWKVRYKKDVERVQDELGMSEVSLWRNWLEELVEDAVGVLCLGEAMAESLENILRQHYDWNDPPTEAERQTEIEESIEEIIRYNQSGGRVRGSASPHLPDGRHPLPPLRIEVARALSHLLGVRASNVTSTEAQRLAKAIHDRQEQIVRKSFTPDRTGLSLQGLVANALATFQPEGDAHTIRKEFSAHMAAFPEAVLVESHLTLDAFNQKLSAIQEWDELQSFFFSQTDYGTATPIGNHGESNPNHQNITVNISFANVIFHDGPHRGKARVTQITHT